LTHHRLLAALTIVTVLGGISAPSHGTTPSEDYQRRVARVLADTPLIDGHNDLPWGIRKYAHADPKVANLQADLSHVKGPEGVSPMTDIPRLRAGHVGGQFWSVWIPVETKGFEAVQTTIEQIDLVKRMVAQYPADFEMAYSAADIRRIHKHGKIASLVGIEGGHQINDSMAVLRQMYDLGARYMTLTHTVNTAWADSATDDPGHGGLTPFGEDIVHEMNRIGMMVDISHVSAQTMKRVVAISDAPVIFSHSSARALNDHPRNVPDDVLREVGQHGGVVMVNFYAAYISAPLNTWIADRGAEQARFNSPPYGGLYIGQPDRAKVAMQEWEAAHPRPVVTLSQVADHVEHIRRIAGIEHVGLGSDFDGIDIAPEGLDGVDKFPALLAELMRRGWSDGDIAKLAGENLLRVLSEVERVAERLRAVRAPSLATLPSAA